MTNATNELKEGNLLVATDIDSDDEIGLLGKNFNAMALRVNDLVHNLEEHVNERTKELDNANMLLKHQSEKLGIANKELPVRAEELEKYQKYLETIVKERTKDSRINK